MSNARFTQLVTVALTALFALLVWKLHAFFHDDAFISLRYARNLALLGDLAWNPGERVEGYTNFLHVLLSAGLIRLGIDPMWAAQLINAGAFAILLRIGWSLTNTLGLETPHRLASLSAVISVPVIGWIFGGLESVLVAALLSIAYLFALRVLNGAPSLRHSLLASLFFALAYLTRPDALVANLACGLALLNFANLPLKARLAHFVAIGSVSALTLIAHVLIRLQVYGLPLPLTFYAKVGVGLEERLWNGLTYIGASLLVAPLLWFLVLAPLLSAQTPSAQRVTRFAVTIAALFLAYIAWSGGDHMDYARILVPLTPLLVLATAALLAKLPEHRRGSASLAAIALSLFAAAILPKAEADNAAALGAVMGRHLAQEPQPLTIALATAGSTPYFATQHTYIDTLGLNDPHIAMSDTSDIQGDPVLALPGHAKGDGAYVLSREPDLIVFGAATGFPKTLPLFRGDHQLLELDAFQTCYTEERHPLDNTPVRGLTSQELRDSHNPESFARQLGIGSELILFRRTCPKS